jgi:hypothetical protein
VDRSRRARIGSVIAAIVVAAASGVERLDEGKTAQGWTLLAGAGIGAVVLAVRGRRNARGAEPS